jgi:hypothetical protein
MRNKLIRAVGFGAGLLMICVSGWAHHGSAISYDTAHLWSTWATVTEFNYLNPHPSIVMKIENEKGENIVGERANATAVDMDGVPGGLQPKPGEKSE